MSESLLKKSIKLKTLGPIADLEKHLPAEWWKTLFNSIYLKTDGDVIENNDNTLKEVDMLIKAVDLQTDHRVLDLCCGQGRHVIELQKRGYENVSGLDRSRYLIRVAKKRAQQLNLSVRFSEGDARKIKMPEDSLDCVVLFGNSFGYFESHEDDISVLNSILRVLKSQGSIVLDIVNGEWMKNNFQRRSWEWIDQNQFVCRERSLSNDHSRIISREVIVHAEKGVIADQFYAERLYTYNGIKKILENLSFQDVKLHGNLVAQSPRDQDLGMMANRMFISAIAPKKQQKIQPAKIKPSILVLLGDPRMPDNVKLNSRFNQEDLETVEQLKTAMNVLPYNLKYLDNHTKLIDYLRQNKIDFVINFCDEGFKNNALQEMHVPAILDMHNISYSGAEPACLALCYNKSVVRAVAQSMEIPVPLETYCTPSDQSVNLPSIFPVLIKPNLGDSSIGITQDAVVNDSESLVTYLENLKSRLSNTPILIQEYLSGSEYSVGLIGNPGNFTILPILTVDYSNLPNTLPKILGYESKWMPNSHYWHTIKYLKAELDIETERQMIDYSIMLFERLGCRDYARFDFRADETGTVKLLEVNPNPGWCWDGKLNLMAGFSGKNYSELLNLIIESALERNIGLAGQV